MDHLLRAPSVASTIAAAPMVEVPTFGRRQFLRGLSASAAWGVIPALWAGSADAQQSTGGPGFWEVPREIWIRRPATGEEVKAVYFADGMMQMDGYQRICHILRDVRMERLIATSNAVRPDWYATAWIEPALLDILYAYNGWLSHHGVSRPLLATSGFRHAYTNDRTEGAAKGGQHTKGGAADVNVPDVTQESVGRYGVWLRAGGVGFYPGRNFTHIDKGRTRVWGLSGKGLAGRAL